MASLQKYRETEHGNSSMESIEPASLLEANIRAGITNESHLQSLGFIMENGRPRFKIDEPVGTAAGFNSLKSGHTTLRSTLNSTDSEESFVVLGKDSLSSVQASSLASFAQIQQKSNSIDYNSMLSALSAEETERKLKELLSENVKLKETLSQNNLAMKQQFNTLAAWQEEIMKVHQSHKQKFSETKELINQLRKENSELKAQASEGSVAISEHDLKVKELETQLEKTLLEQEAVQSARELELGEANSKLIKELDVSRTACKILTADINRHTVLSSRLSQQLKQADLTIEGLKLDLEKLELNFKEKEQLASLADFSLIPVSSRQSQDSEVWMEKSERQEKEITHLKELITSLEQQLNTMSQNTFPSIDIQTGDNYSRPPSEDRLQFIKNVKQYNEILQKLSESYANQGSRYINVQECLKEAIDIIQDFAKIKSNNDTNASALQKQEKLSNCRAKLNDERLHIINERQELMKAQNQYQKVFSDYNSILYELENMHEENAQLSTLQTKKEEAELQSSEASAEMRGSSARDEKLSEDKKAIIFEEKSDIIEEKKAREALEIECKTLRITLNQQKVLQEVEQKTFVAEKKNFEKKIKDSELKIQRLEESLKSNSEEVNRLAATIKSMKKETEKLPILTAQVQVYEADFQEERQARQQATDEKNKLIDELKKLQKMHIDLVSSLKGQKQPEAQQQQQQQQQWQQQSASAPPQSESDWEEISAPPVITAFSCPKCSLSFTAIRPLQEHVEVCLELQ